MKPHKIHLLSILWMICQISTAQTNSLSGNYIDTPNEIYLQVKQFGEFIDRFNYLSDFKGNLITEEFSKEFPRPKYISLLINKEDSRQNDTAYLSTCNQFISYVTNSENQKKISLFSGDVTAFASVHFTRAGKDAKALIELVPEVLPDRSAKWVIQSVSTDCFAAINDSLTVNFIAPNSHETNFINVRKLSGDHNPLFYFPTSLATNSTMLFLTESAKGRIEIQNIEKVSYQINIDNWEIEITNFKRSTNNSGWLISNIENNTTPIK